MSEREQTGASSRLPSERDVLAPEGRTSRVTSGDRPPRPWLAPRSGDDVARRRARLALLLDVALGAVVGVFVGGIVWVLGDSVVGYHGARIDLLGSVVELVACVVAGVAVGIVRRWRDGVAPERRGALVRCGVAALVVGVPAFVGVAGVDRSGWVADLAIVGTVTLVACTAAVLRSGRSWGALAVMGVACAVVSATGSWAYAGDIVRDL
ncbi:MAG: hypothetical protein JWM98_284 [Thermoleophilia bacterium]|nr:hypothetical protein [Thermoleophilia bacterium]